MTRAAELRARDFVALVYERRAGRNRGRGGAAAAGAGAGCDRLLRRTRLGVRGAVADVRRPAVGAGRAASPGPTISWRTSTRCALRCSSPPHRGAGGAVGQRPGQQGLRRSGHRHRPALADRHGAGGQAGVVDSDGTDTPFIDAEAARDRTAAGKRNAAAAEAARPQIAVKEKAWEQVIEDDTLPNIVGRAIIGGFVSPGQAALLEPFTSALLRRRSQACGSGGPAKSRRPSSSACTRRGTSAEEAVAWPTSSWPTIFRRRCGGWCSKVSDGVERALRARRFDAG